LNGAVKSNVFERPHRVVTRRRFLGRISRDRRGRAIVAKFGGDCDSAGVIEPGHVPFAGLFTNADQKIIRDAFRRRHFDRPFRTRFVAECQKQQENNDEKAR
jgi:hypothetical protein